MVHCGVHTFILPNPIILVTVSLLIKLLSVYLVLVREGSLLFFELPVVQPQGDLGWTICYAESR